MFYFIKRESEKSIPSLEKTIVGVGVGVGFFGFVVALIALVALIGLICGELVMTYLNRHFLFSCNLLVAVLVNFFGQN
jgi:hypothetical protein